MSRPYRYRDSILTLERDKRCPSSRRITRLDMPRLHPRPTLDQNHRKPILRLTPYREVIRKRPVRDPLLRPVDDPFLAVLRLHRRCLQAKDVGASLRLGDGEADELLGLQNFGDDLGFELVGAEVENGWEANDLAAEEAVAVAASATADDLLGDNELQGKSVIETTGASEMSIPRGSSRIPPASQDHSLA